MKRNIAEWVMMGEMMRSENLGDIFISCGGDPSVDDVAAQAHWLLRNVTAMDLFCWFDFDHVRVCDGCGRPMCEGYCIDGGREHYCDDCRGKYVPDAEFSLLYADGEGDSYYTSWID